MKEYLLNVNAICWLTFEKLGDKVAVRIEFINGEHRQFIMSEFDWVEFRRDLGMCKFKVVKEKEVR